MFALRRAHGTRAALVALTAVATLGLAACSSSGSSDNGGTPAPNNTAQATGSSDLAATVNAAMKEVTAWPGPTVPVTPPSGKNITVITCGSTGVTCVRVANGVSAAGKVLGWNVTVVDGRNQPDVWNSAISNAIASKTQGIVLAAVPPTIAASAVKDAKDAGIPVIYVLGLPSDAVVATIDMPREKAGQITADWIAEDSGGKAKLLQLFDNEFPETDVYNKALAAELTKVCSGCSIVKTASFTIGLSNQRLPGIVSAALQTNPEINYVTSPFDATAAFIAQGVRQANKTDVKIVGLGADPAGVQAMHNGEMAASLGMPAEWMGWQAVDDLARVFAGTQVQTPPVPIRLITPANAPSGDQGWQGDFDYQAKFKELWGK